MTPKYNPKIHSRGSIRLRGYDYTQPGAYFVTLVAWQRAEIFGDIHKGVIRYTIMGEIAARQWERLQFRFPYVLLGAYVVMPNHLHGIIVINDSGKGAGTGELMTTSKSFPSCSETNYDAMNRGGINVSAGSLGAIVRAYKSAVTLRINEERGDSVPPVWQRNYYEHILRNETEYTKIVEYIQSNPDRWLNDQLHPDAPSNPYKRHEG